LRAGPIPPNVEIVPASQVVEMDESPALALKAKKDSSIMVAMDLIKQGRADALVTAGPYRRRHGGGRAASWAVLPGVDRPALAVQMVTETGPFVLLDIGANMDSTGDNLYQFAHMGSLYAERFSASEAARRAPVDRRGEGQGRCLAVQQATRAARRTAA
jgi:glycerol-3-phosphate acyltransferase PlsX